MKTIYINGIIGLDITAEDFSNQIKPNSTEKLRIIINSVGGLTSHAFEMYNGIKSYKGEVEIVIGTMAASAASYIAMAVPPENRKSFKNSSMMIHEVRGGALSARARDFLTLYNRIEGMNNILSEAYAEGMKIDKKEAREKMQDDYYITGWEQLLEKNVINDIVDMDDIEYDEETKNQYEEMQAKIANEINGDVMREEMYSAEDKIISDKNIYESDMEKIAAHLETIQQEQAVAAGSLLTFPILPA